MRLWQSRLLSMMANRGGGAWSPPADLAAWYYGDSLTDSKWTDRTGNGHHCTLEADYSLSTDYGIIQTAPAWPGTSVTVRSANGAGTYAFWAKDDVVWNVGKYGQGGLVRHSNGAIYQQSHESQLTCSFGASSGWHHYAQITAADGTVTPYKDGVAGTPQSSYTVSLVLRLGSTNGVDDIQLYTRAITPSELADIMANSPGSHAT